MEGGPRKEETGNAPLCTRTCKRCIDFTSLLSSQLQELEEKFRKQRMEHEQYYANWSPHHPIKASVSTLAVDGERVKSSSFSASSPAKSSHHHNRTSLQPLDELVMRTPGPASSLPPGAYGHLSNGNNV